MNLLLHAIFKFCTTKRLFHFSETNQYTLHDVFQMFYVVLKCLSYNSFVFTRKITVVSHMGKGDIANQGINYKGQNMPSPSGFTCFICDNLSMISAHAIGAVGLRFYSRFGQIRQCCQQLTIAATFLQSCVAQTLSFGDGPHHSLHASA